MPHRIAAGEFKAKCLHLLDEVERSRQEILITKRGRPMARLVPVDQQAPILLGRMRGSVQILGDIIAPIDEKWNADQ